MLIAVHHLILVVGKVKCQGQNLAPSIWKYTLEIHSHICLLCDLPEQPGNTAEASRAALRVIFTGCLAFRPLQLFIFRVGNKLSIDHLTDVNPLVGSALFLFVPVRMIEVYVFRSVNDLCVPIIGFHRYNYIYETSLRHFEFGLSAHFLPR